MRRPPAIIALLASLVCSLLFVSCSQEEEDPELVKKLAEQEAQIESLEAELSKTVDKIGKTEIKDPAEDLAAVKVELEKAAAEKREMEKQIAELEEEKADAVKDLKNYQEKYPIR